MKEKKPDKNDLSETLRPFENMWVALKREEGEVLYANKSLDQLLKKIKKDDFKDIEFLKVPNFSICYAPLNEV